MAIQNKTRYAILGVLLMKPCTGYDIKKFCDKTIAHFWNENFGHIYPVLKQLLAEGLICLMEPKSDERRKLYCITDAGQQEFKNWLLQTPQLQPPRSELLLKLSFGNHMPKECIIGMIEEVRTRNQANLELFLQMEASYINNDTAKSDPAFPYWLAALRLGIMNAETAVRWSEDTIQLLQTY